MSRPFKDIIEAANFNGDAVKGAWVAKATQALTLEIASATDRATQLIQRVLGSRDVLRILEDAPWTEDTFIQLTVKLMQLKLMDRFAVDVKSHIKRIVDIYVDVWNQVYVASSTNLIDAFNEQLKSDVDFSGSKLMFEMDSEITPRTLTVESIPIRLKMALLYRHTYSDNWFVTTILQALRTQQRLSGASERAGEVAKSREVTMLSGLKHIAFNAAQEAVVAATNQLSSMNVEFSDDHNNLESSEDF